MMSGIFPLRSPDHFFDKAHGSPYKLTSLLPSSALRQVQGTCCFLKVAVYIIHLFSEKERLSPNRIQKIVELTNSRCLFA